MGITSSMENFKAGVASDLANARDASMDQMINNQKKLQLRIRETQIAVNIAFLRDNFKVFSLFFVLYFIPRTIFWFFILFVYFLFLSLRAQRQRNFF